MGASSPFLELPAETPGRLMRMHESQARLGLLSSSTFSHEGGIQRVTQMVLRVLHDLCPRAHLDLLTLHDALNQEVPAMLLEDSPRALKFQPFESARLTFASAALRYLLYSRPDLVVSDHAHLAVLPWLARLVRRFAFVSFVYHAELQTLGPLRRRALRRSDLIIAISEFAAQETQRVLGEGVQPVVCPLGLQPEYEEWARDASGIPEAMRNRRCVLIVGRMAGPERDKGHESLIRAFTTVARCFPDALLVIVGRGADKTRLTHLVNQLGLDSNIHFAGYVPDRQLPAYYEAAQVFAMPSYAEGFGLVYLEAMFHGRPCIAGNQDAAREVVLDQETGLLVQPGNVQDLEGALIRLLSDPETAARFGAAGRRRWEQHFTFARFAERLSKLLSPMIV